MLNQILMDVQNISAFTDWSGLYVWKIFTIFWQVQLYQSPCTDACVYARVKQLLYSVILTRVLLSPTLRKDLHVLLRKNMFQTLAYNFFWIWPAITSTDVPTIKNYIELRQRWGLYDVAPQCHRYKMGWTRLGDVCCIFWDKHKPLSRLPHLEFKMKPSIILNNISKK